MPDEKIFLRGTKEELMELIPQVIAFQQILHDRDIGTLHVTPIDENKKNRPYRPRVTLHFKEDTREGVNDSDLATGEASFRLMDETSESITQARIDRLSSKIEQVFATGNKFSWIKGKQYVTYYDIENGYQLQIPCLNKSEAKDLTRAVLSIQGHTYLDKNLRTHTDEDEEANYPNNPGTIRILGETVDKPKLRPVATVRFTHATILIWVRRKPRIIVDTRAGAKEEVIR